MSRQVWKHTIHDVLVTIPVTPTAKVVLVDMDPQTGHVAVWIEDETSVGALKAYEQFAIVPTGIDIPPNASHVGSVINPLTKYVWHVYRLGLAQMAS